jgi:hypothetical protein
MTDTQTSNTSSATTSVGVESQDNSNLSLTPSTTQSTQRKIDYLTEDAPIQGQKYVCVSFVSPEGIKNCNIRSFKVRGVFETYEEAKSQAERLQKLDPDYHIFVGEVGKWLPWDPNPETAKDQQYYEKELQGLHEGYLKNREKAKEAEADRKRDMIQKSVAEVAQSKSKSTATTVRERLKKRVEEKKQQQEQEKLKESVEEYRNTSQKNQEPEEVQVDTSNMGTVSDNLSKIKELWAKQSKKE